MPAKDSGAGPVISNDEQLRATRAQHLFMAVGRNLGLSAAYHAFGRAAELEDRADLLLSAAWQVVGRTIVVALSLPQPKSTDNLLGFECAKSALHDSDAERDIATIAGDRIFFAGAPDLRQRTRLIADHLGVLLDAGRKGGSISSATVFSVARNLGDELGALLGKMDQLLSANRAPRTGHGR